jgi:glycosyltransferase involved in cell wall biosynthesis
MIDLLVISTASVTAINRNIYVDIKKRGWNVEMVIPIKYPLANSKTIAPQPQRSQDPVIHFLEMRGSNPRTFYFPELKQLFQGNKVSFVLIENDPVSKMAVHVGGLAAKNGFYLFSLSCENLSFDIFDTLKLRGLISLPSSFVKKYLYWAAKKKINTVFTINNDGTQLFKDKGYAHVIKVPLGFDSTVFYKNDRSRKEIRSQFGIDLPAIAYFGRLVEEKGIHLLLKALQKIKHLNWYFMLDRFNQGTSHYNQRIHELILSLGIKDRILFIEADHYEVADYMNAADVVVIPSVTTTKWKEQYGRVGPEAMACGKLVIASRAGALPELIAEGGIIVDEGDVDVLVSVLTKYLTSPADYDHFQEKALNRARHLSLSKQADLYIARMKELRHNY